MGSTNSSGRQKFLIKSVRSALEAAVVAVIGCAVVYWKLPESSALPAAVGIWAAWAVSTVGVALLLAFRGKSFKVFLRAFGAGMVLRGGVLAALMAIVWDRRYEYQASMLGAYAGGILVFLIVEYRQLQRK